ncbi:hypothetical protein OIU76_020473 [Salix suchowensis]|nr:hypothetical protein OIU76_020473 [Salix suchowensis]
MCIAGSIVIVIHAPQERPITSVQEIWSMAIQPAFLLYVGSVVVLVFIMIVHFAPQCGHSNVLVFTGICSFMGSLSVMSVKAVGTALKLTFEGNNQLLYPETWFFVLIVATCVITQMNYLNKALDTFNTAVVSPIYYVMFTSLTILASVIMFKPSHLVEDAAIRLSLGTVQFFSSRPGFQTVKCVVSDPVSDLTLSIGKIHRIRIGMARMWEASYQKYVASSLFSQGPSYYTRPETLKEVHPLEVVMHLHPLHYLPDFAMEMENL